MLFNRIVMHLNIHEPVICILQTGDENIYLDDPYKVEIG